MITLQNFQFEQNIQKHFKFIFENLKKSINCQYLSYSLENNDKNSRLLYSTNEDWFYEYTKNKLIDNCMLFNFSRSYIKKHNKPAFFSWDSIKPSSAIQKKVADARFSYKIGNGVSFCQNFMGFSEFFGIAGGLEMEDITGLIFSKFQEISISLNHFRKLALNMLLVEKKFLFSRQNSISLPENSKIITSYEAYFKKMRPKFHLFLENVN